ncbi:MAG TPA: hypothetical protein VHG93_17265 [Longimicrobium sp.]|nr:hypothetical protein [Longimicrobium sp.]
MHRSRIMRAAFSAAVALGLGMGVREAVAAPAQEQARRPFCRDDAHCQEICEKLHPGYDGFGFCANQTCYC